MNLRFKLRNCFDAEFLKLIKLKYLISILIMINPTERKYLWHLCFNKKDEIVICNLFIRLVWRFVQICMLDNLFSTQIWHEWIETFLFMAPFKETTIVLLAFGTPLVRQNLLGNLINSLRHRCA